ncbi:Putative rRNA methylase [Gracilibacillus ureilyticus]|uniref:Putative rRNA methylase n=1 Tax=Gracilibacillus ureilyticus TaxID=531814 RepID=A0A1H9TRK3_9BACI|nr:class I SAM-dependent methyltransferase [Gracilibacillus ureilyticus]SER99313.1 Putative rRNA methylase [Gracilibacillus ureilyticus]
MKAILPFSHQLLKEIVSEGDTVIDATCGNGNDTLFLSKLVGEKGKVYGFDIQEAAIENTRKRMETNHQRNVVLIQDGHEAIDKYIRTDEKIAGAIFNLGYLPRGDHSIVTKPASTIKAIDLITDSLKIGGRIVLVVYHGHDGGAEERNHLLAYCQNLDQNFYQVLQYQFINQKNHPPFILSLEKIKEVTVH